MRHRLRPPPQLDLPFKNTWGGRRPGAGRKRRLGRRQVPHRARPRHLGRHPVHVTLRSAFRPLRNQHVFPTLCIALRQANRRAPEQFRIVHFSVQWDHLHLIVEASDARALSSGLRSIAIRVARSVNELVCRRGRFWADRWHGRDLESPREVRNALAYVLANFRKHAASSLPAGIDAFSSANRFDGWHGYDDGAELPRAGPPFHRTLREWIDVRAPRTWLAARGWRRAGLVRVDEAPSA